jgi:lysozyme
MAKRRKKRRLKPILLTSLVFILMVAAGILIYRRYTRPYFIHYTEYGIDLPTNFSVHGIDVSKHQSIISWEDVQQMKVKDVSLSFAFMKATEGVDNVDVQFRRNWRNAGEQQLARGAYHFFIASKNGKTQALNFIRTVDLRKGDLPPVLDVELTFGVPLKDLQQRVSDWLQIVEKEYGVRPIIYTNADFYTRYLAGRFDEYPLWVAHYLVKDKPRIKRDWTFWQHSESGHVNGINAFVDFNVFNGDGFDFEQLKIK